MIEFIHNGFTYRTNGDASIVEGHDGKRWNRTGSLAVRAAALAAIAPKAKTPTQLDAEIADALEDQKRKNNCSYCGKPTRKGSGMGDEGQTYHRSCYKEFEGQ